MLSIRRVVDDLCTILVAQPPNYTRIKQAALEFWKALSASQGDRVSADQAQQLSDAFDKLFQNKKPGPAVRHEAAQALSYVLDFDSTADFRGCLLRTCVPEKLISQAHMELFNHPSKDSSGLLQQRSAHTLRVLSTLASPAEREVRPDPKHHDSIWHIRS